MMLLTAVAIFGVLTAVYIFLLKPVYQPPMVIPGDQEEHVERMSQANASSKLLLPGRYADPDVVRLADGSWRLYTGVEPEIQGTEFEIYTATSDDGIDWMLQEEPVLTFATFPDAVVLPDGRVRLYYQSGIEIVSAISDDGVNFTTESGVRIAPSGLQDGDGVAAPTIVARPDSTYFMIYRASEASRYRAESINPTTTALVSATSQDGLRWMVEDILVDGRSEMFDGYVDGPELFYIGDELHLRFWSSGSFEDQEETSGQYDMVSQDGGETWSEPEMFSSILGGDPSYAVVEGEIRMYYTVFTKGIYFNRFMPY